MALSDNGRRQVATLAPIVQGFRPDHVLCSDLQRARQTAELLGYGDAVPSPAWREMDLGAWTAADVPTLQADRPDDYAAWRAGALTPPGGETWLDFCSRVSAALAAAPCDAGETLLVATHGGVIRAVCATLIDLAPSRIAPVSPASLTVFDCTKAPRLVVYNLSSDARTAEVYF